MAIAGKLRDHLDRNIKDVVNLGLVAARCCLLCAEALTNRREHGRQAALRLQVFDLLPGFVHDEPNLPTVRPQGSCAAHHMLLDKTSDDFGCLRQSLESPTFCESGMTAIGCDQIPTGWQWHAGDF